MGGCMQARAANSYWFQELCCSCFWPYSLLTLQLPSLPRCVLASAIACTCTQYINYVHIILYKVGLFQAIDVGCTAEEENVCIHSMCN